MWACETKAVLDGVATHPERVGSDALEGVGPSRDAVLPDARDDRRSEDERRQVDALATNELLEIFESISISIRN